MSYIVPIVDRVLREGSGKGVRAIVLYPMLRWQKAGAASWRSSRQARVKGGKQ
jgi:hypothetical protein